MKTYAIDDNGQVSEVSAFSRGLSLPEVQAANKTEATALLLKRAKAALNHRTRLEIRDGAFLLVTHNGESFVAESGTIARANSPLCVSHHATEREALADRSFAYYASPEYRTACA